MDPLECQLIAFQAGEFISPEAMEEDVVTLRALVEAGCVCSFSSKWRASSWKNRWRQRGDPGEI